MLTWSSTDATDCIASDGWTGTKFTSGSESTGALTISSIFTLTCTGTGGDASGAAAINVTSPAPTPPPPPPPPTPGPLPATAPFVQTTIADGQAPWGKALGDLDGDNFVDIVIGGGYVVGGNIYWYQYPSWTRYQIGTTGGDDDLQIADINNDGALDVVVNGGIYWYENPRGSGGSVTALWTRHTIDSGNNAHDLVVGDVNADGRLDVVTRGEFGPSALYLQVSPDVWTPVALSTAPNGEGTALGDINRDGRVDIVGNGYWLEQPANPATGTWTKRTIGTWPNGSFAAVNDINEDGRLDVFLSYSEVGVGQLAWFEAPTDPVNGAWTRHDIGVVEDVHRFQLADINRDGKLDVVFGEMHQSGTDRLAVFYNGGKGASWTLDVLSTNGAHNIAIGDVGRDGDIDILAANWNISSPDGGRINLWRNDLNPNLVLNNWTYIEVDASKSTQDFGLAFGDIDGDGRKDILTGRSWYRSPSASLAGAWTRTDLGTAVDGMVLLDADGDGRLDIIAEGAPAGTTVPVYWLKPSNVAATSFTRVEIGTIPADAADGTSQGYALGQLAGNAKPEVILSSGGLHYFGIPANPTTDAWSKTQITSAAREEGIALGDVNRDGYLDIVGVVAPSGTTLAWWENPRNGSGNWTQHNLGTTSGVEADRIALADINGDGRLDVVATETNNGSSGNAVYWFSQPPDATSTAWTRNTIASNQGSLNSMDVADVDGDGKPDVVTGIHRAASAGALAVTVWKNVNNGASWAANTVSNGQDSHLGARLIDLDGDGDLDIVSIAWDNPQYVRLWRNNAR